MTPEELKLREIEALELAAIAGMEMLPLRYAALLCNVSEKTLLAACKTLEIEYAKRGKFYYFPKSSLNAWMNGENLA